MCETRVRDVRTGGRGESAKKNFCRVKTGTRHVPPLASFSWSIFTSRMCLPFVSFLQNAYCVPFHFEGKKYRSTAAASIATTRKTERNFHTAPGPQFYPKQFYLHTNSSEQTTHTGAHTLKCSTHSLFRVFFLYSTELGWIAQVAQDDVSECVRVCFVLFFFFLLWRWLKLHQQTTRTTII